MAATLKVARGAKKTMLDSTLKVACGANASMDPTLKVACGVKKTMPSTFQIAHGAKDGMLSIPIFQVAC